MRAAGLRITGPSTRPHCSSHGRSAMWAVRLGDRRCGLHPSFETARHLCCTRPPDCHVCRSQPRNKARPPYFIPAPCTALLHPWLFEDPIPERLGPRPSTDRTQDTSVQHLSQLILPPKPTPSFAGFSRLEDLRRNYLVWRTFARMFSTAAAANHTPALSLDLGRPTSSRRQLSQAL